MTALVRALGVAAFASMNIMLLAVSVWAGLASDMEADMRTMFHWVQAIICFPAVAYAGMPFYRSAWTALAQRQLNMDVPISLAVILTPLVSLVATIRGEEHAYFDGAVMLLFFLLIGRVLDRKVRTQAWDVAQNLLALQAVSARVLGRDGSTRVVTPQQLEPGDRVLVAAGERLPCDGVIETGQSDLDVSMVTGETVPEIAGVGARVYAGALNLTGPLTVTVSARAEDSLLAELIRLMETAEQGRSQYVRLADKLSRWYAPAVHVLAAGTFIGWLMLGFHWYPSMMAAVTVLIITCPCALGLAMPVVQVAATGRLLKHGVVVKSADALERLAEVNAVVFDKTGTLTLGEPQVEAPDALEPATLAQAAAVARYSRHPLSKALVALATQRDMALPAVEQVTERPGLGLEAVLSDTGTRVRVGTAVWTGAPEADGAYPGPHVWIAVGASAPVLVRFTDSLRGDAANVVEDLGKQRYKLHLLSGDIPSAVETVARKLGIESWFASVKPADKSQLISAFAGTGETVLMVGDGLNDGPALKAAHVSMSPASGTDIAQAAADVVFQGRQLGAVEQALKVGKASRKLAVQNFALAIGYNVIAVPLAITGQVTPLIAAIAMSSSSIIVVLNAMRLSWQDR
jgi:Cu2+-exporting ATPase